MKEKVLIVGLAITLVIAIVVLCGCIEECGSLSQDCCEGNACNVGYICGSNETCEKCGGVGDLCCEENKCDEGVCLNGKCKYKYLDKVGGINIYSEIPISEVENWDDVILFNTDETSVKSCNLEIISVSKSTSSGHVISIEKSDVTGIYINNNSAEIKGINDSSIIYACHIFVCLKEGIVCPENLNKIQEIMSSDSLNIILGEDVKGDGIRGYTEIMMAFGYLQAANFKSGKSSVIYLYLKENDKCKLQPFSTTHQIIDEMMANETVNDCNISGIFIQKSDKNEIKIEGEKIILSGDDEHLYSESVIVSDIIAQELRLKMNQL